MAKTSYGTCALCGKQTSKGGMTRHLKTCPAEHDVNHGKSAALIHLRAESAYEPFYWIDIEVKADTPLRKLDRFLRDIWLECCGHLSMFRAGNTHYQMDGASSGEFDDEDDFFEMLQKSFPSVDKKRLEKILANQPRERSMDAVLGDVVGSSPKFSHEYDFGSTTVLNLKVMGERTGRIRRGPIRLLARNDAPEFTCAVCDAPATQIDVEAMYEEDNPFLCNKHAKEQGDVLLPVVNSPRMGVCGYAG